MIAYGENIKVFTGNSSPEFAKTICKELGIDLVIAVGHLAEKIADGTEFGGGEVYHFMMREDAVKEVCAQLTPGTAMLVKASHAMHFEKLVEELQKAYD